MHPSGALSSPSHSPRIACSSPLAACRISGPLSPLGTPPGDLPPPSARTGPAAWRRAPHWPAHASVQGTRGAVRLLPGAWGAGAACGPGRPEMASRAGAKLRPQRLHALLPQEPVRPVTLLASRRCSPARCVVVHKSKCRGALGEAPPPLADARWQRGGHAGAGHLGPASGLEMSSWLSSFRARQLRVLRGPREGLMACSLERPRRGFLQSQLGARCVVLLGSTPFSTRQRPRAGGPR